MSNDGCVLRRPGAGATAEDDDDDDEDEEDEEDELEEEVVVVGSMAAGAVIAGVSFPIVEAAPAREAANGLNALATANADAAAATGGAAG